MRSRAPSSLLLVFLLLRATPLFAVPVHVTLEIEAPPDQVSPGEQLPLKLLARIDRGWHINAHEPNQSYLIPTELTVRLLPGGTHSGPIEYPAPEQKAFAFAGGGVLLVYQETVPLTTKLTVPADLSEDRVRIEATLRYQACNDATCLPPATARTEYSVPARGAAVGPPRDYRSITTEPAAKDHAPQVERWLRDRGVMLTLLGMVLLGLGLNLTPCVYPLITVTVAYFGDQTRSRRRVLELAALYVLGIAITFSALGVAAGLSGGLFGAALQQPIVLLALGALMVLLALGSFGLYQFQVPAVVLQRAGGAAHGAAGALFMGLTMGIVAAPCVGPIVSGLLVYIGLRQDPVLGFLLFFALALGMGAPYVVLALAAGSIKHLPRSGEWLLWTERLFGCVLLILAVYFVAPLAPAPLRRYLLPAAVGAAGIYLGFIERAGHALRLFPIVKRVAGVALLGLAIRLGQTTDTRDAIAWEALLSAADGQRIVQAGAPLLIDFAADWCIPCREMDDRTFTNPALLREAKRFRMVKADITQETAETAQLEEQFAVRGVPTVILFSSTGAEQRRFVGFVDAVDLLAAMREVP